METPWLNEKQCWCHVLCIFSLKRIGDASFDHLLTEEWSRSTISYWLMNKLYCLGGHWCGWLWLKTLDFFRPKYYDWSNKFIQWILCFIWPIQSIFQTSQQVWLFNFKEGGSYNKDCLLVFAKEKPRLTLMMCAWRILCQILRVSWRNFPFCVQFSVPFAIFC